MKLMKAFSQTMILTLAVLCTFVIRELDPHAAAWPYIFAYWIALTIKNVMDFIIALTNEKENR